MICLKFLLLVIALCPTLGSVSSVWYWPFGIEEKAEKGKRTFAQWEEEKRQIRKSEWPGESFDGKSRNRFCCMLWDLLFLFCLWGWGRRFLTFFCSCWRQVKVNFHQQGLVGIVSCKFYWKIYRERSGKKLPSLNPRQETVLPVCGTVLECTLRISGPA